MATRVQQRDRSRVRTRPAPTIPHSALARRDARRVTNREAIVSVADLRCECGRPDCRATFPAAAGAHRRRPEQFIIVPGHLAGEIVIAAADRFFVVEHEVRSSSRLW